MDRVVSKAPVQVPAIASSKWSKQDEANTAVAGAPLMQSNERSAIASCGHASALSVVDEQAATSAET